MQRVILFVLLFVLPFFVFPFGNFQFEFPKVILSEVFIASLLITVLFRTFGKFKGLIKTNHILIIVSILFLSLFHFLLHPSALAFFGNPYRAQGVYLLWNLLLFSLCAAFVELPKFKKIYYILLLLALISALFIGNITGRAVGTLGEPNALAAFIIFLWPFAFFTEIKNDRYKRVLRAFTLFAAFAVIFLSGSRSGLIAFIIQLAFFIMVQRFKFSHKKALLITVLLIAVSLLFPFLEQSPYENRLDVWNTGIKAGFSRPILGVGFGNTEVVIRQVSIAMHDKLVGYYVDSAHNIFIDWWIQGGIVGVLIISSVIFLTLRNYYKKWNMLGLILSFGVITMLQFNPAGVATLLAFWWLVGASFAY